MVVDQQRGKYRQITSLFVLIVLISLICISPCDTSCNRHVSSGSLLATGNAEALQQRGSTDKTCLLQVAQVLLHILMSMYSGVFVVVVVVEYQNCQFG